MTQTFDHHTFLINIEDQEERLDKMLARRYPMHSRTYFQYLIENDCVLLNGAAIKKRIKPQIGDEISIIFALTPELDLAAEPIALDILYEDEYLLAINKPAGMVVHPAAGNPKGTFANGLLFYCKNLEVLAEDSLRPGIVHRLDKDTSGVLLAAKQLDVQTKLAELFATRRVEKRYIALCCGSVPGGWVDLPIARHPKLRQQMGIVPGGREAQTYFKTVARSAEYSLVQAAPKTGRTHQIRVHLQAKNAPILGDQVYGNVAINKKYEVPRQMLHAHHLQFVHPITQQKMLLTAPLACDMEIFVHRLFPNVALPGF